MEPTEFVWGVGIASQCDKGVSSNTKVILQGLFRLSVYAHIKSGDVIWIPTNSMKSFYLQVFPKINVPVILVVSGTDESFPSETGLTDLQINQLVSSDYILHIFAQNCDGALLSSKISHLPIGVDYHTIAYKYKEGCWGEKGSPLNQEAKLKQILQSLVPTYQRKQRAYVDFQHHDNIRNRYLKRYLQLGEDRTTIFERLLKTGVIDYGEKMSRSLLWETKGQYAFSISPHGNGLDCHRTWEDLILGCIVIVKTSPLDPMYAGLPVVIVQDWSEVTKENMELWIQQYGDAFTNPSYREKLTNAYWLNQISNHFRYKD